MRKTISLFLLSFICGLSLAQYVEPERSVKEAQKRKISEVVTYPSQKFDSIAAKNALTLGTGKITGTAFTRTKNSYGMKVGQKVLANQITIQLFPVTPYFEEYYKLWKDKSKNNPKQNRYVYMDTEAYRYRLEAITNSSGEFTFPDMKPGKYYLWANLDYALTYSSSQYTGSGYGSYGTRVDYYKPTSYNRNFSEFLELFVEVKSEGQVVDVKLR